MSNIDLASKEWCDLVFEGRNQGYGAYAMRAKASKRRLVSVIYVLLGIVALAVIIGIKTAVTAAIEANRDMTAEMETSFAELKKEEPKKEEPKQEIKQEYEKPVVQKVAVKASIAFTVPDIVDEVDETKALKSQQEVPRSNIAISSQDYVGDTDDGIDSDDLKKAAGD